jgi:hypothetical protein
VNGASEILPGLTEQFAGTVTVVISLNSGIIEGKVRPLGNKPFDADSLKRLTAGMPAGS